MRRLLFLMIMAFLIQPVFSQFPDFDIDSPDVERRYEEVITLYDRGDYIGALSKLNDFIESYPTSGHLYYSRGLVYFALRDIHGARMDLTKARSMGYIGNGDFVKFVSSNEYIINEIMEEMYPDIELDPKRDLRPVIMPSDTLQGKLRPERTCYDVYFYDLTVKIIPESKSIIGTNYIYFNTIEKTNSIQVDLFAEYEIFSIVLNGNELNYKRLHNSVFIDLGQEINAGDKHKLEIVYGGIPREASRPPWSGGFVWKTKRNKHWIGVACEHLGASSWWPCKDHLSDKPDSMRIDLRVPEGYQGISNGNLRSTTSVAGNYTSFEWFVSYPIINYGVTVYMGDFVNFNEQFENAQGSYSMDYYVLPHNLVRAKTYYSQTRDIITIFEKLFGEYPFTKDGIAMVEAPYAGMEHQSAIAIGDEYSGKGRREYWTKDFDYIVVHELAHEWWGNSLSIGDMADAWINEGFGTYSEYLFAELAFGYEKYIEAVALNQEYIFNLWPLVGERDINSNTFIGGDIYNKGAALLNNLRCIINDDPLFLRIIRDFYNNFKFKVVTTTDFVEMVNEYTGKDYSTFFNVFLYSPEPPILECIYTIDKNRNLTFNFRWLNMKEDFEMPFCLAINGKETIRLVGTTKQQTLTREKVSMINLPDTKTHKKVDIPKNSFTYFWTRWAEVK